MILKESFRMQNHLADLAQQAQQFLSRTENVVHIRQEHLRSRRNPSAADEIIEVQRDSDMVPDKVIGLYLDLLAEREKLSAAISKAKASAEIDMDSALAINKIKQDAIRRFQSMARIKSTETMVDGRDYLINSEGNQTPYVYTIRSVQTIDFDRDMLKGIIRRLQRETDEISTKVDLLNVTLEVDYTAKYGFDDSFEDAYMKFVG